VGQLYFEKTITSEKCQNILTQFIDLLEDNKQGCWFSARLGESPYCERTTAFLQNFFGDRVDGRGR